MASLQTAYGPPIGDISSYWLRRAMNRGAFIKPKYRFIDFAEGFKLITNDNVGGGLVFNVNTEANGGGGLGAYSGTVANDQGGWILGTADAGPSYVGDFYTSGNWWFYSRTKINFAIDASSYVGPYFRDVSANTMRARVGAIGPVSTTKFGARIGAGSDLLSTISLDTTAYHDLELWAVGSTAYLSVDNETPVSVAATLASAVVVGWRSNAGTVGGTSRQGMTRAYALCTEWS